MAPEERNENTQELPENVASLPSRQTTGERFLENRHDDDDSVNENEFYESEDEINTTPYRQTLADEARSMAIGRATHAYKKKLATKKVSTARVLTKTALRFTISILILGYLLQLLFALIALLGFGFHGGLVYAKEQTILGKAIGIFWDFEKTLPFERVGLAFWGLGVLLTFAFFIVYLFLFRIFGIDPFRTALAFFLCAALLALNLFPITNLFPWLLLWVCYVLFSKQEDSSF